MRLLILAALLATSPLAAQPATSVSFAIDMTDAAEVGWFDPAAESVGVRGEGGPLSWETSVQAEDPDGDYVYDVTIPFEVADSLVVHYKFHAAGDGDEPNGGWESGRNRTVTLHAGADLVAVARRFDEPLPNLSRSFTGTVEVVEAVPSAHLDAARDVFVYLPPGYYDDLGRRYPVLYLHDGQHVFDASDGTEWGFDEAAEQLIAAGEIEPAIIVGVANSGVRTDEYTPTRQVWEYRLKRVGETPSEHATDVRFTGTYQAEDDPDAGLVIEQRDGGLHAQLPGDTTWTAMERVDPLVFEVPGVDITMQFETDRAGHVFGIRATRPPSGGQGPAYGRFLVEELKPSIDARYRTDPERAALGGSSLGGLITLALGLEYPDVYEALLVVSPSVWWDREVLLDRVAALDAPTAQRVWVSMGTGEGEGMVGGARRLSVALAAEGWTLGDDLVYVEDDGEHNETSWNRQVPAMLRFLYGTDR